MPTQPSADATGLDASWDAQPQARAKSMLRRLGAAQAWVRNFRLALSGPGTCDAGCVRPNERVLSAQGLLCAESCALCKSAKPRAL